MKPRKPKPTAKASLLEKLDRRGCTGGLSLTLPEADALTTEFELLLQRVAGLSNVNLAMAEAIKRQGFQVVHQEHEDGRVSFDLQRAPDDEHVTVN